MVARRVAARRRTKTGNVGIATAEPSLFFWPSTVGCEASFQGGLTMGRGRAKAKQTKVARELKYSSGGTDLERLRAELTVPGSAPAAGVVADSADDDDFDDLEDDEDNG